MKCKLKQPDSRRISVEYTYKNKNEETVTLHFNSKNIDSIEIETTLTKEDIYKIEQILPVSEICD